MHARCLRKLAHAMQAHRTPTFSCSLHWLVRMVLENSSRLLKSLVKKPFFFSGWRSL